VGQTRHRASSLLLQAPWAGGELVHTRPDDGRVDRADQADCIGRGDQTDCVDGRGQIDHDDRMVVDGLGPSCGVAAEPRCLD